MVTATVNQWRNKATRIDPWLALVTAVGAALALYYAYLGFRYYQAVSQAAQDTAQIQQLDRTVKIGNAVQRTPDSEYDARKAEFERTRTLFTIAQTDGIVAIILSTARASGVVVQQVSIPTTEALKLKPVTYTIQPFILTVQAPRPVLYGFLQELQKQLPAMEVANVSLNSLDGAAQVRLELDTSPVIEAK